MATSQRKTLRWIAQAHNLASRGTSPTTPQRNELHFISRVTNVEDQVVEPKADRSPNNAATQAWSNIGWRPQALMMSSWDASLLGEWNSTRDRINR